jgi:molybdopterin molybdotransferase
MDGYACIRADLPGPLEVLETIPAGKWPTRQLVRGTCSQIMTGAVVPDGADCVVMKEYVKSLENGRILFATRETDDHIDQAGQDLKEGDLLLGKGIRITPGHTGILASAGKMRVEVSGQMKVGILATGSELVNPARKPEGAQIRNSNSHQLAAQVRRAGHLPEHMGIVEDLAEALTEGIREAVEEVDLLLLTGGASVGDLDLVPEVLRELGFRLEFDRVAMQPGKPVCFGHREDKRCFGLSGNPVSSFVQFELLVRPYLQGCAGERPERRRIRVRTERGFRRRHADRPFFLPVTFTEAGNCEPVAYHGSGHLHALAETLGFAEMAAGQATIRKGDFVYVRLI